MLNLRIAPPGAGCVGLPSGYMGRTTARERGPQVLGAPVSGLSGRAALADLGVSADLRFPARRNALLTAAQAGPARPSTVLGALEAAAFPLFGEPMTPALAMGALSLADAHAGSAWRGAAMTKTVAQADWHVEVDATAAQEKTAFIPTVARSYQAQANATRRHASWGPSPETEPPV